jgi:hypothetical protein
MEDILDPEIREYLDNAQKKRGKKYCICGEYIPARLKTCPHCNKEFAPGEKYEPPKVLTPEEQYQIDFMVKMGYNGRGITFPTGKCPVTLNPSRESIPEWVHAIIEHGKHNRCIYFPSAIKYWLREFVDVNSKDYKIYTTIIDGVLS